MGGAQYIKAQKNTQISIDVVNVPAGQFIQGSSQQEREYAYQIDEKAYGHNVTRKQKWYANEFLPQKVNLKSYAIGRTAITNAQYYDFIKDTGHPAPYVDAKTWASYGLIHPYKRVKPYLWKNGVPPKGREQHPVVLVSYPDARAYTNWLSKKTGVTWRLPSEQEWEKAARGPKGLIYPWGNNFNANYLNSHDKGPFRTTATGAYPKGASPYGAMDMAGQVYEWTKTPQNANKRIVKGGSWDDKGCGVCRTAARHGRPEGLKHILIGFRVLRDK